MIIRHAQRRRFTTIDRAALNDKRLSFRARGILSWLLDKPDNWDVRSEAIADEGTEGRDAIRTALNELESYRYVRRLRRQVPGGQWITETWVFERPNEEAEHLEEVETSPGTDSQASVDRPSVSQALSSSLLITKTEGKTSRGTQLPNPFTVTPEMESWARGACRDIDVDLHTQRFVNHFRGEGKPKKDWVRTWKNWMLREQDRVPQWARSKKRVS